MFVKEIFYFVKDLLEGFTFSVKSILRPTTLSVIIGVLYIFDVIFQAGAHSNVLIGLLIFLIIFTEFIRGDWKHRQRENLYQKLGVKRVKPKDLKRQQTERNNSEEEKKPIETS